MFRPKAVSAAVVVLLIAAATAAYIYLGYLNLLHLRAGIDLGTYTQLLHNVSEDRVPPFNTLKGMVAWGDHAHIVLAIFAPLFSLWPGPMFVVVLQVIAMTSAAWPLYCIAQKRIGNYFFSVAVAISYLLFFGIQHALDIDFHANTLTAAVLAWSFYAFEFRCWKAFWITFVLGLLTREDAPVFYAVFGGYILLAYRKQFWKFSVAVMVISVAYFLGIAYWVMPMWQADGTPLAYFDVPEETRNPVLLSWWIISNPKTIWQNMTDSDVAVRTMRSLFQSFGFLPLGSPFTYLMAAPNFLARFLSGETQRHMMKFHYSASLASILSYGAILTTYWMVVFARKYSPKRAVTMTISSLAALVLLYGTYATSWGDIELPLVRLTDAEQREFFYGKELIWEDFGKIAAHIGPEDSVAATSAIVPVLATRQEIYLLPDPLSKHPVDWVVISGVGNGWPLSAAERKELVQQMVDSDEYERVAREGQIVLFKYVGHSK